ncbi:DUF3857 domain-containing transglutaminase family protein [Gramella sp. MT6]|uniref:DUF3857 domain-containing protein n=1 Tax=Gramella sp. MT6 TaxID=2705471 RepID=UPI001C5D87F9|nr:DUF3857 domain-containing protein [Gramella sp. MT6]QYA24195.1 DUF3857 domain-containing transglutaminase family protein [Gramella sp. MT6]
MRNFLIVGFLGLFSTLHCQENYKVSNINLKMLTNANAVIREHTTNIEIKDIDDVEISTNRVVTVLNEAGEAYIEAYENFDKGLSVQDQEALILDKDGNEIRIFKKRDFKTRSNFQGFVLFSDNQVSYLQYTPRNYPYTVKYSSRVRKENSIFLPDWRPLEGYKVSVERSVYKIVNNTQIPIRYSERNFDSLNVEVNNSNFDLKYSVTDLMARSHEKLSPSFEVLAPHVRVALQKYFLEGIEGESSDWKDFGAWQYKHLVEGQGLLSEEIVRKVTSLTKDAVTDEEKARIIYKYVQENTRYIAVMLGIGGWKPYSALEVDRLGYGDCKGLTNYTRALLKSQGIEADYTIVYGGSKRDIDPDFTKMQGNHVILSIPQEDKEDIWLECTSQDAPFNYLGDFTDDRWALKLKPEGGEIVRTKKYSAEDNLQSTWANILIKENGGFKAHLERSSYGVPYGDIYLIELQKEEVQKNYYNENWSQFQNLSFDSINFINDKKKIEFKEDLYIKADRFCNLAGERLLVPLNFVSGFNMKIDKDKNRKNKITIERGKTFKDNFKFELPSGFAVEAIPESQEIESDFGKMSLSISVEETEDRKYIAVERYLRIEEGEWSPEKFENFRKFINQIHKLNSQKAVIVPTNKV